MVIQGKVKRVIKRLAAKYGLTEEEATKVVFASFRYTKQIMEDATPGDEDSFQNVRIKHIGIFAVKPNRIKKLEENAAIRDDKDRAGDQSTRNRD